ncbi:hypothetical protein FEM48_Zijuj10G0162300 [Ziziphus jujuba var. spinosa]|uniref:Uncharacterized protein n=1 Tax=Ziziphus jujuba var. spinosa TaxID=714518 RepID=A0A978UPE2_ZIZJJ|nr:hypothetical protein FEM48_Zijuj10G0162300 [Ziziphus jujuba var. spinosa]
MDALKKSINGTNNMLRSGPTPPTPGVIPCDTRIAILFSIVESLGYQADFASSWIGNEPCDNGRGITCIEKNIDKNIAFINFGNMGNFSRLATTLRTLNLVDTNVIGSIPIELITLPHLRLLDVSNNWLHGKVPPFRSNVIVKTNGNSDIGKDIETPLWPKTPGGGDDGGGVGGSTVLDHPRLRTLPPLVMVRNWR